MSGTAAIEIFADAEALAQHAAGWLTALARAKAQEKHGHVAICLSGGSTPRRLYQLLAQQQHEAFPWARTHWFWGDERFVPHSHPDSNYRMAREAMLAHAPVPPANIHAVLTDHLNPQAAAAAYESELHSFYGAMQLDPARPLFDVVLLGLGEDGHTASLFPGDAMLQERKHWVGAVIGARDEARITLTYPVLQSARATAFLVAGAGKRAVLDQVLSGSSDLPAARLHPQGSLAFLVDRAARPELKVSTERDVQSRDRQKRAVAQAAAAQVSDGMVLGLGSGSTAELAIAALAKRVASGLKIVGIPSSQRSAELARRLNIPLGDFAAHSRIDLTIDGADQVERGTLNLIKGLGGALLREKIVASASARMLVVVDASKLVTQLGGATPLPVEIAAFGWQATMEHLRTLGVAPHLRQTGAANETPFVTDGGNYIADCAIATIDDAAALQARLHSVVGVLETGLFVGLASQVLVGGADGVTILER